MWFPSNKIIFILVIIINISLIVLCDESSTVINNGTNMDGNDGMKIVGASQAKRRYDYMVSLQVYISQTFFGFPTGRKIWAHNCGGSIYNDRCIITAAHCVDRVPASKMSILVGTNNLSDGSGQRYFLKNYTMHEEYIELNRSDIAILKLNDSIKFSNNVGPINVTDDFVDGGVKLKLTGWGYTIPPRVGSTPNKLREANLTSMTTEKCNEKGMPAGETEICCYEQVLKGACGGDSGGPLVLDDPNNPTLVGIVSYGAALCATGSPDVFTRASVFVDWIKTHCEDNEEVDPE